MNPLELDSSNNPVPAIAPSTIERPILVGLSGKKNHGKDAIGKILRDTGGFIRVAFADALKREVSRACGVPVSFIEENKDSFRLILQGWGMDFRRKIFGDDYWLLRMSEKLSAIATSGAAQCGGDGCAF